MRTHTMFQGVLDSRNCCDDPLRYVIQKKAIWLLRSGHTAGLVILPSSKGTLKSTRMRTRFPLRSRSVMDNLFERDMVDWERKNWHRWPLPLSVLLTKVRVTSDHTHWSPPSSCLRIHPLSTTPSASTLPKNQTNKTHIHHKNLHLISPP